MIDLSNGRGKVIITWAQIIGWSGSLIGLGMVWRDINDLKDLVKAGIYSKAEVDQMQMASYQRDLILAAEIDKINERSRNGNASQASR
jgi:hypothetical protein